MNMSISASWLVLAVLLLRAVLQKAPKWVYVLLWGIVVVAVCFLTNPAAEREFPIHGRNVSDLDTVNCTIKSEGLATAITPAHYPSGFDWEYSRLPCGEMHSSGTLVFSADRDIEELIVSENYYEKLAPDATMIHKGTYTLVRNDAGEFELDVTCKNPGKEEMAVYFIKGEVGTFVMKIKFS